jgi:hypothetical protein
MTIFNLFHEHLKVIGMYIDLWCSGNSELLGFWTWSIVRCSRNYKMQCFRKWICFRPQVRGKTPTLLVRLERANLNQISETLCILFLEYRTMDEVQKTSNSDCYTPSSGHFRIYLFWILFKTAFEVSWKSAELWRNLPLVSVISTLECLLLLQSMTAKSWTAVIQFLIVSKMNKRL